MDEKLWDGDGALADPPFAAPAPPQRAGEYRVIYADPPWREQGAGKVKRGADRHYPLLDVDAICAIPAGRWAAPHAHLYLWATNNHLPDAFEVMRRWGFRYVTMVTWFKGDFESGALQVGLGQYFRGCTEHCLFGVRGMLPYRVGADGKRAQGRTGFMARRGEHSVKPEVMRAMIESVSAGPYLEVFARRPVAGWDVWGNEV